jgi:hypothetical protein
MADNFLLDGNIPEFRGVPSRRLAEWLLTGVPSTSDKVGLSIRDMVIKLIRAITSVIVVEGRAIVESYYNEVMEEWRQKYEYVVTSTTSSTVVASASEPPLFVVSSSTSDVSAASSISSSLRLLSSSSILSSYDSSSASSRHHESTTSALSPLSIVSSSVTTSVASLEMVEAHGVQQAALTGGKSCSDVMSDECIARGGSDIRRFFSTREPQAVLVPLSSPVLISSSFISAPVMVEGICHRVEGMGREVEATGLPEVRQQCTAGRGADIRSFFDKSSV